MVQTLLAPRPRNRVELRTRVVGPIEVRGRGKAAAEHPRPSGAGTSSPAAAVGNVERVVAWR